MSISVTLISEADGTLRYDCGEGVTVRVMLHRRNGTKKCPVELLYQDASVIKAESNLLDLRDIESLFKHANTLKAGPPWHEALTAVARELPEKAQTPWAPVVRPLDSYMVERKDFLWYPALPKGEPVSIVGDPGSGKSALLVKLMCHLTSGTRFPTLFADHSEHDFEPRNVVLFTYEDDPHSTIKPRVLINGGDPARVQIVEGKRDPKTEDVRPITLKDIPLLEELLKTYNPAIMAFDPIQSFFGSGLDMNAAGDTRPILDAVRNLCKGYGCTPLYIRHTGKSERRKAIHAALGSIDITANMRSVLALYKHPDDADDCGRRILAQTKTNGRWAPSMQLKLVGATLDIPLNTQTCMTVEEVRVDWDGKSDFTAEDLNAREGFHQNDTEEAQSALDQAREFLRDMIKEGPVRVEDLLKAAGQAGIQKRTLERAKNKEGVKARRVSLPNTPPNKSPWEWYGPDEGTQDD